LALLTKGFAIALAIWVVVCYVIGARAKKGPITQVVQPLGIAGLRRPFSADGGSSETSSATAPGSVSRG
jgi:hypothetical protein